MTEKEQKEALRLLKDAEAEHNARRFWAASEKFKKAVQMLEEK